MAKDPAGRIKRDRKTGKIYELAWVCVGQASRGCGGGAHVASNPRAVEKGKRKRVATEPARKRSAKATKKKR